MNPNADRQSAQAAYPLLEAFDDLLMTAVARKTGGLSYLSIATAMFDWTMRLALAPGRRVQLAADFARIGPRMVLNHMVSPMAALGDDGADRCQTIPALALVSEAYDEFAEWAVGAAGDAPGVSQKHKELVRFAFAQALEAGHPENVFWINQEALSATAREGGANLVRGWRNFVKDMSKLSGCAAADDDGFTVGENVAATSGKVVYRNRLMELIQYTPTTGEVAAEPILITPAWIMKYYILDLSEHNSLVRYLVDQGFTVFMISWINPRTEDSELSFDDYRRLGVLSALDAVADIVPGRRVHAVGYCLGGTLLSIAAAALARDGDDRLASVTLLAAQTDFRDPGELSLFIGEGQLELLDVSMEARGVLRAEQMTGAFKLLRSRDLIWKRLQRAYYLGEEDVVFDLMAWNADATRMPYRMHSEYLRRLFLNNDFVHGRFEVDGRPVAVSDIRAPIFALGTERDHVAPWRSVFKIHLFADTDVTFALTNGGHNAGIVSEPGHARRRHRVLTKADMEHYIAPDAWLEAAELNEGSWWPTWAAWLTERSSARVAPPETKRAALASNDLLEKDPLPAAPGSYVLQT